MAKRVNGAEASVRLCRAERGRVEAQSVLACWYQNAGNGLAQSHTEAVKCSDLM